MIHSKGLVSREPPQSEVFVRALGRVVAEHFAGGFGQEGEDDEFWLGGEVGEGGGVGVAEDAGGLVEAALPAGLGGVAEDEGVGGNAGGGEHGAGEGEEVWPVGDDGDEVIVGVGKERGEEGGGGGDGEGDEFDAGGEEVANEGGFAGTAEGDGAGEGFGGEVVGGEFADGEGGGGANFGEEDAAEFGVGVDEEQVVGGRGGEPEGDAGADGFGRKVELADGAEEAGDVVVEALLGGGDGVVVGADVDAAAVAEFGPAFALEFAVAGAYGVGMEGEAAGEFAGAGKAVAGVEVAGEDGEDNLGDELAIERDVTAGSKPQAHRAASRVDGGIVRCGGG